MSRLRFVRRISFTAFSLSCASALTLASLPAQAMFELKLGYAVLNSNPSALNSAVGSGPSIGSQQAIVVDALVMPPKFPLGLGVRYESFTQNPGDGSTVAGGAKSTLTRVSVIINKRLVDTGFYFGPIATIGVSNALTYALTKSNVTANDTASGSVTASAGLEAGAKVSLIRLGGEVGYLYAPLGNLKSSSGADVQNNGSSIAVDYSGAYARATLGFGF